MMGVLNSHAGPPIRTDPSGVICMRSSALVYPAAGPRGPQPSQPQPQPSRTHAPPTTDSQRAGLAVLAALSAPGTTAPAGPPAPKRGLALPPRMPAHRRRTRFVESAPRRRPDLVRPYYRAYEQRLRAKQEQERALEAEQLRAARIAAAPPAGQGPGREVLQALLDGLCNLDAGTRGTPAFTAGGAR